MSLSKESLETVTIPMFTSPVDGQTYTVTLLAQVVANIRDQMLWGLREVKPATYASLKTEEVILLRKEEKDGSTRTGLCTLLVQIVGEVADLIPEGEKSENRALRSSRHLLTDLIEVMSPEVHAQYHATKYPGGGKATKESRKAALLFAADYVAKLAVIPGF